MGDGDREGVDRSTDIGEHLTKPPGSSLSDDDGERGTNGFPLLPPGNGKTAWEKVG